MEVPDYDLPEAAIAQTPVEPRDSARLLDALDPGGQVIHRSVRDLPGLVGPGDVVVVNDSRVIPARLRLSKASGGAAEVMLLEPEGDASRVWNALVRPGRRLPPGTLLGPSGRPPVVEVGERLADGRRVIDQEWVQVQLARLWARAEYLKLINWKVAWAADKGLNPADASATKVYGSEFALEAYRVLGEIVGQAGYLAGGSPGAVLGGRLEHRARSQTIFTFGGGTNEIQRDIISWLGLGLPRSPR